MFDYRTSDALILFPCRLRFGCLSVGEKIKTHTPNQTRARSFRYRFLSCLMHVLCAYIYIVCGSHVCASAFCLAVSVILNCNKIGRGQTRATNLSKYIGWHAFTGKTKRNKQANEQTFARTRALTRVSLTTRSRCYGVGFSCVTQKQASIMSIKWAHLDFYILKKKNNVQFPNKFYKKE